MAWRVKSALSSFRIADPEEHGILRLRRLDGLHHIVGARIVFAVAKNDERAASLFDGGEFHGCGMQDRVVESGAAEA